MPLAIKIEHILGESGKRDDIAGLEAEFGKIEFVGCGQAIGAAGGLFECTNLPWCLRSRERRELRFEFERFDSDIIASG